MSMQYESRYDKQNTMFKYSLQFQMFNIYRKTSDRSPRLLSVQLTLTPGLYPGPGVYAGPGLYQ